MTREEFNELPNGTPVYMVMAQPTLVGVRRCEKYRNVTAEDSFCLRYYTDDTYEVELVEGRYFLTREDALAALVALIQDPPQSGWIE